MTNEQEMEIVKMRIEGYTMQAIGKKMGVTKQRIHQILNDICMTRGRDKTQSYIYPNIDTWLRDNRKPAYELAKAIGVEQSHMSNRLRGKTPFKISEIKKILDFTGMTFEEAFKE